MKPRTIFIDFELHETELSVQEIRDRVLGSFDYDQDEGTKAGAVKGFHTNVADATKPKKK